MKESNTNITTAIIPTAGVGNRLSPLSLCVPKEMLPIYNKPAIYYAFKNIIDAGIKRIIVVINENKPALKQYIQSILLEHTSLELIYIHQDKALGLGDAINCCSEAVDNNPFIVVLPDEIFISDNNNIKNIINLYADNPGNIIGVVECEKSEIFRYGVIDIESQYDKLIKVKGLIEKPKPENAPSNLAIVGPYLLMPEIFKKLQKQKDADEHQVELTAAIEGSNSLTFAVKLDGERYDCGNFNGLLDANIAMALQHDKKNVLKILNTQINRNS